MEEQKNVTMKGGTMRLGAYECRVKEGSRTYEAYNCELSTVHCELIKEPPSPL